MKKIFLIIAAIFFTAVTAIAAETILVADSMRYDPNTGLITATGNVRITNPDGEVFGDNVSGYSDADNIEMHGNVRGHYKDRDGGVLNFSCASAEIVGRDSSNRVITAKGGVNLSKGNDTLSASTVVWHSRAPRYSASGGVLGEFAAYSIDADDASREEDAFSAQNVRRFYERTRNITISASRIDGIIKDEEVVEMTAGGGVVITMRDRNGVMTRAIGARGIYSVARGTVVLSGGATITQTGRVLNSDEIVYFLDTGHIDAQGSPSIIFETDRSN